MQVPNNFKFSVGNYEGGFLAVSKVEPIFCLHGKSEKEAVERALRAWGFYLSGVLQKAVSAHEKGRSAANSNRISYTPSTIITAEAC